MFLYNSLDTSTHMYLVSKLPSLQAVFLCSCPTHWTSLPTGTRQTTQPASHFLMFLSNSLNPSAHRYLPNYPACKPFSYVLSNSLDPSAHRYPPNYPACQQSFPRGTPPPLWTAGERPGCDLHLTFIRPTTTRCPSTAVEMATTSVPLCRTCQHSPQR